MRRAPAAETEVKAGELVGRLLEYFDSYRLATVAPLIVEIEKALDAEYRRGVEETLAVYGEGVANGR